MRCMEKFKTKDLLNDLTGEKEKPTNLDVLVTLFPDMTILKTRSGILIQTKSNDWHNEPYGGR